MFATPDSIRGPEAANGRNADVASTADPRADPLPDALTIVGGTMVKAVDGELGPILALIIAGGSAHVVDLAVRNGNVPGTGRLVPLELVETWGTDAVSLGITRKVFFRLERLVQPDHLTAEPGIGWGARGEFSLAVHEHIPPGTRELRQGAMVIDAEGRRLGRLNGWRLSQRGVVEGITFETLGLRRHTGFASLSAVRDFRSDVIRLA